MSLLSIIGSGAGFLRAPAPNGAHPMRRLHLGLGLAALALLIPFGPVIGALGITTQLLLVALPIAVLGLMHGAVDPWVGDRVLQRRTNLPAGGPLNPIFFAAYLSLMALVVVCWIVLPLATLTLFLAISVLHFGAQDAKAVGEPGDLLAIIVLGAVPVLGPIVAHPAEVAVIFDWLVGLDPARTAPLLRWFLYPVIAIWLVGVAMLVSRLMLTGEAALGQVLLVLGIVVPAMFLLPPLVAFAAYFCLLHSLGHVLDLRLDGNGPWRQWTGRQWMIRLWPATAGAIGLGALALVLIPLFDAAAEIQREALARVIFCGLAALTVPHVLLHALDGHDRTRMAQARDRSGQRDRWSS